MVMIWDEFRVENKVRKGSLRRNHIKYAIYESLSQAHGRATWEHSPCASYDPNLCFVCFGGGTAMP